jgi:thioredoxin reductase
VTGDEHRVVPFNEDEAMRRTELLVVGAGPYGIAVAAYAKSLGLDVALVGRPLELWKSHMPRGMFLRSAPDWHLDARGIATFEAYLAAQPRGLSDARPVALGTFIDYASWFMAQYDLAPCAAAVTHVARADGRHIASLDDGSAIEARQVVLAPGFAPFKCIPGDLAALLPAGSFAHTCDAVDLERYRGRRVLIVGGRQSAFEWAALLNECGAESVDLTFRHATPAFDEPDWSWTLPMSRRMLDDHAWWRGLTEAERQAISDRFWAAGRLTLEPWLDARVHRSTIRIHPRTRITAAERAKDGTINVAIDDRSAVNVHDIVLATGYRIDMRRIAYLDRESVLSAMAIDGGYPVLDPEFQTSLPGLYVTGLAAVRDFGPFFGFTVACPVAARVIGDRVALAASTGSALMAGSHLARRSPDGYASHAKTVA